MTAIAMELKDVGKSFGSVIALSNVSVKVRQGAVTCILAAIHPEHHEQYHNALDLRLTDLVGVM